MVKCDEDYLSFKYYNENGEHEFIDVPTYKKAAEIISNLILCPEFHCDMTISHSLYIAMRKLQGFSDKDIHNLMKLN